MPIKEAIESCFRDLVIDEHYKDVTVVAICKKASVSRAAFYDFFINKEAVLESIVRDEIVTPMRMLYETIPKIKIKSTQLIMTEVAYENISKNRAFYSKINKVEKGSLLIRVITNEIITLTEPILQDFHIDDDEKSYTAFFFSAASAMLISQWLERDLDIEPARLSQLFNKWTLRYWQEESPVKLQW